MSDEKTGGPAFPQAMAFATLGSGIVTSDELGLAGMTLRDYFAAKAMQAAVMKAQHNFAHDGVEFPIDWADVAESAYDAADEMLKERAK